MIFRNINRIRKYLISAALILFFTLNGVDSAFCNSGKPVFSPNQVVTYLLFPEIFHIDVDNSGKGSGNFSLNLVYSSFYNGQTTEKNKVNQLFEMQGLYLNFNCNISDRFGFGAEIPYFYFSKSRYRKLIHTTMDDFYVNYVRLGDRYLYRAEKDLSAFGDISLLMTAKAFETSDNSGEVYFFCGAEIPTGSKRLGLSNGETDFFTGSVCRYEHNEYWACQVQLALFEPGGIEDFREVKTKTYFSSSMDFSLRIYNGLMAQLQTYWGNNPLRDLNMTKLSSESFHVSLGLAYESARRNIVYSVFFTEDLTESARSVPDYSFGAGISFGF